MAFITNASEFNGQENEDVVLRPIFTGDDIEAMGIRTIFSVKSSVKVTFFDAKDKILRKYADGFQGGSGAVRRQKKFELEEFKAEAEYSKQDYKNSVQEEITNSHGAINQNDITGDMVHDAEVQVFSNALRKDTFRIFWLADKVKKHVEAGFRVDKPGDATFDAAGAYEPASGGDDVNYNVIDGVWKEVIADAAVTPNINQIKRIVMANGTVAQSIAQTLASITAGTIDIEINSVSYTEVFDTDSATTVANWVATHGAALLLLQISGTNVGAALTIASTVAGQPYKLTMVSAGTSGTWTPSASVANTPAQPLGTDEARDTFKLMINDAPKVLKQSAVRSLIRFYATDSFIENYNDTLDDDGTELAHTKAINGVDRFTYRGVPIIPMEIDDFLSNDFVSPFPHRAILTMPTNLVLIVNSAGDIGQTRFWFNIDTNTNRQRAQFEFGAGFILPEWMVAAF